MGEAGQGVVRQVQQGEGGEGGDAAGDLCQLVVGHSQHLPIHTHAQCTPLPRAYADAFLRQRVASKVSICVTNTRNVTVVATHAMAKHPNVAT